MSSNSLPTDWYVNRRLKLQNDPNYEEHARKTYLLPKHPQNGHEIVWVNQAYNPIDLRSSAPVPRHKPMIDSDCYKPNKFELLPHMQAADKCIKMSDYESTVATRDEDSTTLTLMLPTTGVCRKVRPPSWGTDSGRPPILYNKSDNFEFQYHHMASPMTRYIDQMHHTNKLFKLH